MISASVNSCLQASPSAGLCSFTAPMPQTELLSLLESLETDIDRQRNLAPELKASMLGKIGRARVLARSAGTLDRLAESAQELGLGY